MSFDFLGYADMHEKPFCGAFETNCGKADRVHGIGAFLTIAYLIYDEMVRLDIQAIREGGNISC
jgi:hypothetical protein